MRHGNSEKVLTKQKLLSCSFTCTLKISSDREPGPPNSPTKYPMVGSSNTD